MKGPRFKGQLQELAVAFVAVVSGLRLLTDMPLLPLVVFVGLFVAVRLVLFHTRRW